MNKHNNRTAIDRHRDKTNEMLEHNAQFWTSSAEKKPFGLVNDDDESVVVAVTSVVGKYFVRFCTTMSLWYKEISAQLLK